MPPRSPQKSTIRLQVSPGGFLLVRPGARYAVHRELDALPGAWVPNLDPLADGWSETFTEIQGRLLLPFLRTRQGRHARPPTSPDGRLIARACRVLGLTGAELADSLGSNESVLSRARRGKLPAKHREAIRALLKGK